MNHPFDLAGRVAVVTGAGSGIGRATALLLHRLGASVVPTDIDEPALAATCDGTDMTPMRHDVTAEADWAAVFQRVEERFDGLDVLVNNAGVMMSAPFEGAPLEHLRRQYRVNVESVFMGMQGAIPLLKRARERRSGSSSIINVSSIYGQVGGAQFAAYSASKGAVRALTKATANELAPLGIRVNSIHPGPTATNLAADWDPPVDAEGRPVPPEMVLADWLRLIPMGRIGSVDDIAPVIAFLASDAAAYITGAELVIDGGYTAI